MHSTRRDSMRIAAPGLLVATALLVSSLFLPAAAQGTGIIPGSPHVSSRLAGQGPDLTLGSALIVVGNTFPGNERLGTPASPP